MGGEAANADSADVLADPLWVAALPLAAEASRRIEGDLTARREALAVWRDLERHAARSSLTTETLADARSGGVLEPYPHARGFLARVLGEPLDADQSRIHQSLVRQSDTIARDVAARMATLRMWTRMGAALDAGQPQLAQRILADARMAASDVQYPDLGRNLSRIQIAVRRMLNRGIQVLQSAITDYARERKWHLVAADHRFVIDHLLTVELSDDRTTRIQARRVRSLAWDVVRPVLDTEYDRVWGRARRGTSDFQAELLASLGQRRDRQEYVRLRDVYEECKGHRAKAAGRLSSYYRDEFSADLSVLLTTDIARRFEFSAIRDARLAFSVVLPDGQLQQYGFIRLRGQD